MMEFRKYVLYFKLRCSVNDAESVWASAGNVEELSPDFVIRPRHLF
jgi:hypothetical protein